MASTLQSSFDKVYQEWGPPRVGTTKYVDLTVETGLPDAQADIPVPFVIGRRRIESPNVIAVGPPVTKTVTEYKPRTWDDGVGGGVAMSNKMKVPAVAIGTGKHGTNGVYPTLYRTTSVNSIGSDFQTTTTTVVDFALGICLGPGVEVMAVYNGDNSLIYGSETDLSKSMAGDGVEYDLLQDPECSVRFYSGSWTQGQDPTLIKIYNGPDKTPAHRGTAIMVFKECPVTVTGVLDGISYEVVRLPNPLGLEDDNNVSAKLDINIATAIYELLTSDWGGIDLDPILILEDSFVAAANTLAAEGNFCSVIISNKAAFKSVLVALYTQANGTLRWNSKLRGIEFVLFREDFGTLALFDEYNTAGVDNFEKGTWYNKPQSQSVTFAYRDFRYKSTPAIVGINRMSAEHAKIAVSSDFTFICEPEPALMVAVSEFAKVVGPLIACNVQTNRDGFVHEPGDVIALSNARLGLDAMPMRITQIKENGTYRDTLTLQVTQADLPYKNAINAAPITTEPRDKLPVEPPEIGILFPLPMWLAKKHPQHEIVTPDGGDDDDNIVVYGVRTFGGSFNFRARTEDPVYGGTISPIPTGVQSPLGALRADMSKTAEYADGVFASLDIDVVQNLEYLKDVADKQQGSGIMLVGNEYMAYETLFTGLMESDGYITLFNVHRGLIDTVPEAHENGDEVIFIPDISNIMAYAFAVADGPRVFDIHGLQNDYVTNESIPETGTPTQRYNLPAPPYNTMVAATAGANAVPRPSGAVDVARSSTQYVSWKQRDRKSAAIVYRDDPGQSPAATTYTVTLKVGAYTNVLASGVSGNETAVTIPAGATVGAGTIEVRATDPNGSSLYSDFALINVT